MVAQQLEPSSNALTLQGAWSIHKEEVSRTAAIPLRTVSVICTFPLKETRCVTPGKLNFTTCFMWHTKQVRHGMERTVDSSPNAI